MKVLISQPMMCKTNEELKKNRENVVKQLEAEGHEIIDSVFDFDDVDVKNKPLFYLAKSLSLIAEKADMVYFMKGWNTTRGCFIEHDCCVRYGVLRQYEE